ncbi:uncharacterized protein LOC131246999 [Magnolia sinica]|uniref:uncharacterized protein LOC131246999 n=1 Tax=Magnolia sinica TaxID=86752 RepID=UPI002658CED4|nr:uncharacterized protein LOC131246999 [Magnolia sinica]
MDGAGFSSLDEGCITHILSLTSPSHVCRSSSVCSIFQSAAESDAIWERFLPSDYSDILSRSVSPVHFSSKKDLYFSLCKPILIDDGKKSFWLEKSSGKKCYMVSARDLSISWGDDDRYWRWPVPPCTSVFPEVAELILVWWFNLSGSIDMAALSPGTMYTVRFIVRHTAHHYGWQHAPVNLSLHVKNNPHAQTRKVLMLPDQEGSVLQPSVENNGWMEVEVGEFFCDGDGEVEFRMYELHEYKEGIMVMGVEIRPSTMYWEPRKQNSVGTEQSVGYDSEGSANLSIGYDSEWGETAAAAAADFDGLNESCISHVLSLTSPPDVCRSSAVSTIFRSASESDAVWERFLPSDYPEILSRSASPVDFSSKKELFFRLCDSIPVDGGKMRFWLEKWSGRKCYTLSARELLIIWGDTPRYWRWISLPESRFSEVAELLGVCWLEIHGKFETCMLSAKTTYSAFLIVKFLNDVQGLDSLPMELTVRLGGKVYNKHTAYLLASESRRQRHQTNLERMKEFMNTLPCSRPNRSRRINMENVRIPSARTDGWMEIDMGEFFVDERSEGAVEMSLMEVKGGHLKGGMIIEGIEIRPKK